jgi:hypothetical protein
MEVLLNVLIQSVYPDEKFFLRKCFYFMKCNCNKERVEFLKKNFTIFGTCDLLLYDQRSYFYDGNVTGNLICLRMFGPNVKRVHKCLMRCHKMSYMTSWH